MDKNEANKIIKEIHKECKSNRMCEECSFYLIDHENNIEGCIFDEVQPMFIGKYEL